MQGNFTFQNPARLHFGKESLAKLSEELKNYGPKVMLTYGGGSTCDYAKAVAGCAYPPGCD